MNVKIIMLKEQTEKSTSTKTKEMQTDLVTGWKLGEEEGGECRKNRNEINRRT
jgi:hypothetical protein